MNLVQESLPALRVVVFDLDGVLVHSEHLWEQGWEKVSSSHGYAWTGENTRACQGKSVPEWSEYLGDLCGINGEAAGAAVIALVVGAYDRGEVPLLPGALELVQAAAARVPIGLATSAPREIIERVMRTTPLGAHFTVTVSSAEVPAGKPSPDVYLEAIRQLNADPTRSFGVEDSSNGIRAAAAAGLTVLGMEHSQYPVAADAAALTWRVFHSIPDVTVALVELLDGGPGA